jgi:peptidoglycan L-alanyl-D-glutamate endopeptidase CwlK
MSFNVATIDELSSLNPRAANLGAWLIWYMNRFGAHVHVTEGLRSPARQRALFEQGRTTPGPIVTNTLQSRHLTGRAFDVDFVGVHPDQVDPQWWQFIGRVGEALGLRWGGRWAMRDFRHFEG